MNTTRFACAFQRALYAGIGAAIVGHTLGGWPGALSGGSGVFLGFATAELIAVGVDLLWAAWRRA